LNVSRRQLLKAGSAVLGTAALCGPRAYAQQSAEQSTEQGAAGRRISLINLHTEERLELEYSRGAAYLPEALEKIEVLLRDFRNGEQHPIDPKLLDYLVDVAASVGTAPSFSVISGYRSPQTNQMLHEKSSGVSQRSLHMQGRAIDVRVSGIDCAELAAKAESLQRGGVGYYHASNFVHLDTGAFRTWRG